MPSLIFYLMFSISVRFSIQCEVGWRQSAVDSRKCYLVVVNRKIWFDAEMHCQAAASNAHLTSVASAYETFNINAITTDTLSISQCDSLWIGGNDFEQSGKFVWTNGNPFIYSNWAPDQPDQSNHCTSSQSRTTGIWKAEDCGTEKCFICESYSSVTSTYPLTTTTSSIASTQPPFQTTTQSASTVPLKTTAAATTAIIEPTSDALATCGWNDANNVNFSTPFGQYCYSIQPTNTNWTNSKISCREQNKQAFLSDVPNNETQVFLNMNFWSYFGNDEYPAYWIGLNCLAQMGQWEWDMPDGVPSSLLDPMGFLNWAPGEPAVDANKRCAQVRHTTTGEWFATDCSTISGHICQKHK